MQCENCGGMQFIPGIMNPMVQSLCVGCGFERPYMSQPGGEMVTPENGIVRNIPTPGQDEMGSVTDDRGGNPLNTGNIVGEGWRPANKRDDSFASASAFNIGDYVTVVNDPDSGIWAGQTGKVTKVVGPSVYLNIDGSILPFANYQLEPAMQQQLFAKTFNDLMKRDPKYADVGYIAPREPLQPSGICPNCEDAELMNGGYCPSCNPTQDPSTQAILNEEARWKQEYDPTSQRLINKGVLPEEDNMHRQANEFGGYDDYPDDEYERQLEQNAGIGAEQQPMVHQEGPYSFTWHGGPYAEVHHPESPQAIDAVYMQDKPYDPNTLAQSAQHWIANNSQGAMDAAMDYNIPKSPLGWGQAGHLDSIPTSDMDWNSPHNSSIYSEMQVDPLNFDVTQVIEPGPSTVEVNQDGQDPLILQHNDPQVLENARDKLAVADYNQMFQEGLPFEGYNMIDQPNYPFQADQNETGQQTMFQLCPNCYPHGDEDIPPNPNCPTCKGEGELTAPIQTRGEGYETPYSMYEYPGSLPMTPGGLGPVRQGGILGDVLGLGATALLGPEAGIGTKIMTGLAGHALGNGISGLAGDALGGGGDPQQAPANNLATLSSEVHDQTYPVDSELGQAFMQALPQLLQYAQKPESGASDPHIANFVLVLRAHGHEPDNFDTQSVSQEQSEDSHEDSHEPDAHAEHKTSYYTEPWRRYAAEAKERFKQVNQHFADNWTSFDGQYSDPSSVPNRVNTDDSQADGIDGQEKKDGDSSQWQLNSEFSGGGSDSPFPSDPDVGTAFFNALQPLTDFYDHPGQAVHPQVQHLFDLAKSSASGDYYRSRGVPENEIISPQESQQNRKHVWEAIDQYNEENPYEERVTFGDPRYTVPPEWQRDPLEEQYNRPSGLQWNDQRNSSYPQTMPPPGTSGPNNMSANCPNCNYPMTGAICPNCQQPTLQQHQPDLQQQLPGLMQEEQNLQSIYPQGKTASQGPSNIEQVQMIAQYLQDNGRGAEIPNLVLNPDQYAQELAAIQQKGSVPVPEGQGMGAPPMQGGMPPQGQLQPGGGDPSGGSVSMASYLASDNVAKNCPNCNGHTTGLLNESGFAKCHTCGHTWKMKDVLEDTDATVTSAVDNYNPWQTQDGAPLRPGMKVRMFTEGTPIPDEITITQVSPNQITYTLEGAYGLNHQAIVTKDEAQIDGLYFQASETPPDAVTPETTPQPPFQENNADNTGYQGTPEQDNLAIQSSFTKLCSSCHSAYQPLDNNSLCDNCSFDRFFGEKTAGAQFSRQEQAELINEPGIARNLHQLDLTGSHYTLADVQNMENTLEDSLW